MRPDRQLRLLHGRGIVVTDRAGAPVRMVGTAQDLTELNQVEQALRDAKDQFQAVLDAVPGAVSWIGADLKYLGANHHLAQGFHLSPLNFVGEELGFCGTSPEFEQFVTCVFRQQKFCCFRRSGGAG